MRGVIRPLVKGIVFTVVTVLATAMLAVTIANRSDGQTVGYRAVFTDVTSLNPGDDIRMAGVRIGEVEDIRIVDRRDAEVSFSVDSDRPLYTTTTAAVKFRNLTGQRYIALDHDEIGRPLDPGATIPLDRTRPALNLTALFNGFKPLFQALTPKEVNQLSMNIVQVLQGEGGTIDSVLRHTASLTSTLANKDEVIGRVVTNLNTVLDEMTARGDQLGSLIATTRRLVSGLADDAGPIGEAIGGMAALTSSTASLLHKGRGPLKKSVRELRNLTGTLVDNTPEFERFLNNLPLKYTRIGRAASYGSWLNFYLCGAVSDAERPPGGPPVGVSRDVARCGR
ncbi:MlaD family protein [Haloechinothrix salitolerans]|uniref:MlaD family protein n=1 Tax=Haloechinothrix salitolerans TaxID=926830 RepID=A0ABW2C671_9PSEU